MRIMRVCLVTREARRSRVTLPDVGRRAASFNLFVGRSGSSTIGVMGSYSCRASSIHWSRTRWPSASGNSQFFIDLRIQALTVSTRRALPCIIAFSSSKMFTFFHPLQRGRRVTPASPAAG